MSIDTSYEENRNMVESLDSISYLEDLSNEILYEIFEYIELHDLFQAFTNLNNRFETLLNYSFLSLQVNLDTTTKINVRNYYTQLIIPNKHRIVSLYLTNRSDIIPGHCSFDIIDSSFNRLQSLVLDCVSHNKFISFLPILSSLSRLSSITLHINNSIADLSEPYQLIFRLPFLKQTEISAEGYSLIIPLLINTSEEYSRIKRLIVNHACNFQELIVLLSNTPLLTHLTCIKLTKPVEDVRQTIPIKMVHLTSIIFHMCDVQFEQLEVFIKTLCKQIRILCINTSEDVTYLDATRWERLISQDMPYLHLFEFKYHEWHYQSIELMLFHHQFTQCTSLFWINRGCLFQITADIDYWPPIKVIYSIRSNGKKCSQSADIKLTIDRLYFAPCRESLADEFFSFISNIQITQLEVDCKKLLHSKFIQLLALLPNLKSLTILSLSSFKLKCLSQKIKEIWPSDNQITKLVVESINEETDLEKIQYFIDLCPRMEYLKVKCENHFHIELIVRTILMKNINKHLDWNLFCLCIPIANDDMINQLQIMIDSEKLIDGFRLTRTTDRIYLQWNFD